MTYEVDTPILNSPFEKPTNYWFIQENEPTEKRDGRRPPIVYPPRDDNTDWDLGKVLEKSTEFSPGYEMTLVNLIRRQVQKWREQGYPGVSRVTLELLKYWSREGRERRLFFAQREAVETIIFLVEGRQDLRQGIQIPLDNAVNTFLRYACKMATGSGKTTVMAMLAAWSILNKVTNKTDKRFSDVILIVCPNITIKGRLQELNRSTKLTQTYPCTIA
jgi:type III restriction enzyme